MRNESGRIRSHARFRGRLKAIERRTSNPLWSQEVSGESVPFDVEWSRKGCSRQGIGEIVSSRTWPGIEREVGQISCSSLDGNIVSSGCPFHVPISSWKHFYNFIYIQNRRTPTITNHINRPEENNNYNCNCRYRMRTLLTQLPSRTTPTRKMCNRMGATH